MFLLSQSCLNHEVTYSQTSCIILQYSFSFSDKELLDAKMAVYEQQRCHIKPEPYVNAKFYAEVLFFLQMNADMQLMYKQKNYITRNAQVTASVLQACYPYSYQADIRMHSRCLTWLDDNKSASSCHLCHQIVKTSYSQACSKSVNIKLL